MVLSSEKELPDIFRQVNIVYFREAMTSKSDDYDIAFIEGSITTEKEARKLKHIRKNARIVVALGACSSTGGLNCLKNRFPIDEVKERVYGRHAKKYHTFDTRPVKPVDEVIHVDYYTHGCPISKKEFLSVLNDLVMGKVPFIPNYPVCADCKMAGNICVFERGMTCLGTITRAGCDAVCVTYGCICWGCRGLVDNPNITAHEGTLKRYGLSPEAIARSLDLYGTCKPGK
jgi:coenzyme F420-reducing hydrogenase gamma subunit